MTYTLRHDWAGPHPMTSYGGVPANQNVTIYSNDSYMGALPPPTMTSYRGVPANQNVTIYSDDSFMGVPPPPYDVI